MKKLMFVIFISFCCNAVMAEKNINPVNIFALDDATLEEKFSKISSVEKSILNGSSPSVVFLDKDQESIYLSVYSPELINEHPLGIPSFIWGCVISWPGILLVHIIEEDKEETKKALYGCLVGDAVKLLFWVSLAIASNM